MLLHYTIVGGTSEVVFVSQSAEFSKAGGADNAEISLSPPQVVNSVSFSWHCLPVALLSQSLAWVPPCSSIAPVATPNVVLLPGLVPRQQSRDA